MVVGPSSPLKTVADFVAYARANPTQATIGTTFAGSPVFMASALFMTMTGLQAPLARHSSDAAGIADLLAGKVPLRRRRRGDGGHQERQVTRARRDDVDPL